MRCVGASSLDRLSPNSPPVSMLGLPPLTQPSASMSCCPGKPAKVSGIVFLDPPGDDAPSPRSVQEQHDGSWHLGRYRRQHPAIHPPPSQQLQHLPRRQRRAAGWIEVTVNRGEEKARRTPGEKPRRDAFIGSVPEERTRCGRVDAINKKAGSEQVRKSRAILS
jgi:hypothetical protein